MTAAGGRHSNVRLPIGRFLYLAAMFLAVMVLTHYLGLGKQDVVFCRKVFTGLARGKPSVQRQIDWEHLKAMDVDVGSTYQSLPTDLDRAKYREKFVRAFSTAFKFSGSLSAHFVNWRIEERLRDTVIVAADFPRRRQTLLLVIPASGKKQLVGVRWKDYGHVEPCCGQS